MTNYIVIWERDGNEGFNFINAEDEHSAINQWLDQEKGYHPHGCLHKMIITETCNTYKVPLGEHERRNEETMIQTKHRPDLDTDEDFCIEVIYPDGTTLLINVPKSNPELTQPPTQPYGLNMVFGGHYE